MTALAETVRALGAKLAMLESQDLASSGDWVRLDAAATRAALMARHEFCGRCELDLDRDKLVALLDELRYIKLRAQFRLLACDGPC